MRRFAIASGGVIIAAALGTVDAASASATSASAASAASAAAPQAQFETASARPKAAAAKPHKVKQGPRFNLPTGKLEQQGSIDLYIKKLIRHAPKGSEIDVALFRLRTKGMAKELVRAGNRKVKVRVILDSDSLKSRKGVYTYLRKHLGTGTRSGSWIKVCPKGRGCIAPEFKGQWSKNHNKFYAFSHTYGSRNVVVQTSGNATGGMYNQYNDAYTLSDAKLYKAYRKYFYDLFKHRPDGDYYRTVHSGSRSVSFFPKASGDPIADVLDKVGCEGGTKVRLSSGMFTRTAVSSRLSSLDDAGCDVRVVSGSLGESTEKALSKPGPNGGPDVHLFNDDQQHRAHSKYLLIDGRYAGRDGKIVMTGSHSYTTDALRHNDEAVVTVRQAAAHDAYSRNFDQVFGAAKGRLVIAPWKPSRTVPDDAADPEQEGTPPGGRPGSETPELQVPEGEGPAEGR